MPLTSGARLGNYEIVGAIGAGGMGEVYRARDSRLGRMVAIKVLPEALAVDPERLARFEREAKVLASLNHPHIAAIYGVEDRALVMELVEGDTLRGPMALDDALPIVEQIAEALEYAHERGIVHRDLKPANIKVTPDGTVKVLDFGLAKAFQRTDAIGELETTYSPTLSLAATHAGVILGTAAYMAPEQARGKSVDTRADIWAFGVVLYELLTGERLFKGEDLTETLASVVKEQPDISKAPVRVHRLLRKCLEKDPRRRLRDIGDAWELLDAPPIVVASAPRRAPVLPWAVAAIFAIVAGLLAFIHFREPAAAPAQVVRFQIPAPEAAGIAGPVISPDGKRILYQVGSRLWLRDFDAIDSRPLVETQGSVSQPFWSADSRFVVFGVPGALKKIEASGGPPQSLSSLPGILGGGFWTTGDRIVFSSSGELLEVNAGGGQPSPVRGFGTAGVIVRGGASVLPDGRHVVYTDRSDERRGIYVASLDGGENPKKLLPDQSQAAYVPSTARGSGYLLFLRGGALLAQPLNSTSLELAGEPVRLAEQVQYFSASASGALVYRTGAGGRRLTWFNREGKAVGTAWAPGEYVELTLSPDGSRVAVVRMDTPPTTWIHEFDREATTRTAFGGSSVKPVWSPDGTQLVVSSNRGLGQFDIVRKLSNGTGKEELLLHSDTYKHPLDISRDGRWLLYGNVDPKTKEDLWLLPLGGDRTPEPFLVTDYTETDGAFSPDGRFIAYVSDESGRFEVYVRAFPASAGGKWVVSNGGGYQPRWRRDGRELFYFTGEGRLMSVDVAASAAFQASPPALLFQAPIFGGGGSTTNHYWDVAADGQRFLINTVSAESGSTSLTVVLNWQAGLKP